MKRRLVCACLMTLAASLFASTIQVFGDGGNNHDGQSTIYVDSPYPGVPVHFKSQGDSVRAIQQQLNADGYSVGPDDGIFGSLTQKGVRAFQAVHGLARDGIVGPQTWVALFPPAPTELLRKLQTYIDSRTSDVSIAVYNAYDGQTQEYNPYSRFDTASIIKPLILATLLHSSEVNETFLGPWERQLALPMIEQSDNQDATELWNLAGSSAGIQAFATAANMDDTVANPYGYWGLTTTSAVDQVTLLNNLVFSNSLLDANDRHYELKLMHNVISWQRWGITAGVPNYVYVAIKNGWLPLQSGNWEINSIGYVDGDGRKYTIAVLTKGNPTEQYGISTVEEVSRIVWANLAAIPARSKTSQSG